jgi:hypothetical protein
VDFRQDPVNGFTVEPGVALDQAGDGQHHGKPDHADQDHPVLEVGQKAAVQGFSGKFRYRVVKPAQGDHAGKAQHADVGVGDHPVVEMGHALDVGQGHERALDADEEVHDGAGEDKFGTDVGVDLTQFPLGRVPDVDQKGHDRDDHGHAVHDGHHLEPGGHRHLQQMVGADVGVDHDQGPESQQGEGVAVKGRPAGPRDHIIGHRGGKGVSSRPKTLWP